MRLLYLCMSGSVPSNSDFTDVDIYLKSIPEYLQPNNGKNKSPHMCFFANRIGTDWNPKFFDFVIVFLSERFLNNEKALECLKYVYSLIPNLVCIDLYDNLSSESKHLIQDYSMKIFSSDKGRAFLLTNFTQIASEYEEEKEQLRESIESEGYKYLDNIIAELRDKEKKNKYKSYGCYIFSFLFLLGIMCYSLYRVSHFSNEIFADNIKMQIIICIYFTILLGITLAISRFLFLMGKSFMVESIRNSDRAHAIGLGKLYLQLYRDNFEWKELKDVLQNWNIDSGSAFITLDSKDIVPVKLNDIVSSFKKVKNT